MLVQSRPGAFKAIIVKKPPRELNIYSGLTTAESRAII